MKLNGFEQLFKLQCYRVINCLQISDTERMLYTNWLMKNVKMKILIHLIYIKDRITKGRNNR